MIFVLFILFFSFVVPNPRPTVLVLCGSFSPITKEHVNILEVSKKYVDRYCPGLKVVTGFLSPVGDAYSKPSLISSKHRVAMSKLAIQGSDWLNVNSWESEQANYTRTGVVLKHIKAEMDCVYKNPKIILVCAAEIFSSTNQIKAWSDESLRTLVHSDFGIIMLPRDGSDIDKILDANPILKESIENILVLKEVKTSIVSSTLVRNKIAQGEDISDLVHPDVKNYILQNKLFVAS